MKNFTTEITFWGRQLFFGTGGFDFVVNIHDFITLSVLRFANDVAYEQRVGIFFSLRLFPILS